MGLFPYICTKCRGGDFRCGSQHCEKTNCKGSQCCWEEKMVLVLKKNKDVIVICGKYDGYGRMITDKLIPGRGWTWKEFGLKLEKDGYLAINLNQYDGPVKNNVEVYCNSCY
jgi:hypothetical protein|uniref:Uncharacterized protein n=1 Tax=Mimiviridae sp. ChoanoV1 TaxID=2596887 RepID=A0A5B8IG76_9VIRU|nr:hypothetical protein 3_56 [Mimiviridae sp. ChoanoV1]